MFYCLMPHLQAVVRVCSLAIAAFFTTSGRTTACEQGIATPKIEVQLYIVCVGVCQRVLGTI